MARDDSMYDYLRPDGGREWQGNHDLNVCTVCEAEDRHAEPLYNRIGGEACLYVKTEVIEADRDHPLHRALEAGRYCFRISENGVFHERPCVFSQELVVQNGTVIGSLALGERCRFTGVRGSPEEWTAWNQRLRQNIFLPLDGEARLVDDVYLETVKEPGEPPTVSRKEEYRQFITAEGSIEKGGF